MITPFRFTHFAKLSLIVASLALAASAHATPIGNVFVIDMEGHNWSNGGDATAPSQLQGNAAAPYINGLVNGTNGANVSFGTAYHNVLATSGGSGPSIHPSEPNHIWLENGSNLGTSNNNDPYATPSPIASINQYLASNPSTSGQNLTSLLQTAGIAWKTYLEDSDMATSTGGNGNTGGTLTSTVAPQSAWTVPLTSFSGTSASYTNPFNGSHQYNYTAAHCGPLFFTATNGSTTTAANTSTSNPEVSHYAPLQQLEADLTAGAVARYNLIEPDQYNDMHAALNAGLTYNGTHYTGDLAEVAQGDKFLSVVVPEIEASQAFGSNGLIVIRTIDTQGTNPDDFTHTLMEIVISPMAKGNSTNVADNLTHSADLATFQEIFGVSGTTASGYLNDAANASPGSTVKDLADFFQPGTIPQSLAPPVVASNGEPTMPEWMLIVMGVLLVFFAVRRPGASTPV